MARSGLVLAQGLALVTIGVFTAGPSAQGLGDVARAEAARRTQVVPGKRYTNGDVPASEVAPATTPTPPPAAPQTTSPVPAATAAEAKAGDGSTTAPADDARTEKGSRLDEKTWREQATRLRTRLDKQTDVTRSLEQRLRSLEGGPQARPGSLDIQGARASYEDARKEEQLLRRDWEFFETRARTRGVPAEWLR